MQTRLPIDLSHSDEGDVVFSRFWHGHPEAMTVAEYPEWIRLCKAVSGCINSGDHCLSRVLTETLYYYDLKMTHEVINLASPMYTKDMDDRVPPVAVSASEYAARRKALWKEFGVKIWDLDMLKKLIRHYLEQCYQNEVVYATAASRIAKKVVDDFLLKFIHDVINPVARMHGKKGHCEINPTDAEKAKISDEMAMFIVGLGREKCINAHCPDQSFSINPAGHPEGLSDRGNEPEGERVGLIDHSDASPPLEKSRRSKKRYTHADALTPLWVLAGALFGVLALGVVIAASHGVALPFIAAFGLTMMAGHGGVSAGMALGVGILGITAASAGAVGTYVMSTFVQGFRSLFGEKKTRRQSHKVSSDDCVGLPSACGSTCNIQDGLTPEQRIPTRSTLKKPATPDQLSPKPGLSQVSFSQASLFHSSAATGQLAVKPKPHLEGAMNCRP